ncbi:unnamed protein product [Rotaria sp. Silwood2]|nr:unnamed protein product [Rotaria sp. Silwood2]CAF4107997.1 unnamed protein product [Rotaria sp. Silwood2]
MDNQDNSINNDHQNDENEEMIPSMTTIIQGDTYPISDSESTTDVTSLIDTNVVQDEEQGELILQLRLRCSLYEHIEIIRVIYGYSKQRSINQCQFSIYDCIQEGSNHNILSCNGKQTCLINLTKNEILSTTITTHGVPACSDFNYVQVNFGCVLDAKDICDSWKDEGTVIHLSHTRSQGKQYNECQCKVRSSLSNGQVLLHAREINRQFANLKDLRSTKNSNTDCRSTTYLEISTDRSERKCMDNLPSNGNALFGSGSHNFTLNYVRNDPLSELFFYFELKASPVKSDHYVQIICNWARRTTTMRTTLPMTTRKRKITTINMSHGLKLSRLDLIRHPSISENELNNHEIDDDTDVSLINNNDETETTVMNNENEVEEDEEKPLTTNSIIKSLKSKTKKMITSTTILIESTTIDTPPIFNNNNDDDEWSRILSMAGVNSLSSSSEQFLSFNNETFMNSIQASILSNEEKSGYKISKKKFLIMCLLMISITIFILLLYCLKLKQSGFIRRLKININIALLFCCEASKLLFSSSSNNPNSISSTSTNTMTRRQQSLSLQGGDYHSSEYYVNDTGNNFHTTESIYDYDGGGKSIYSIDDDQPQRSIYITQYDRYSGGDTC